MARFYRSFLLIVTALMSFTATAGKPEEWQLGLQAGATPLKQQIYDLHHFLLIIMTVVAVFVLGLLVYVAWRFHKKRNPVPSKRTHHVLLEVIWTAVPIIILLVIAVPSFNLIYEQEKAVDADVVLKVDGNQWYWTYEYPDAEGVSFDSYMIPDAEIDKSKGQQRLLSVDNPVVLPVGKIVRLQISARDVLHSFAVPAFGIKVDAVPGRLNEAWVRVDKPGVYYGQCSEICGTLHGFMPIEIRAVSDAVYQQWLKLAAEDIEKANQYINQQQVAEVQ